jgi:endonuclease/exonuclease/phosphatase family metal-dependent hydrolase
MAVPGGVIHNEHLAERAAQLDVDLLAIQEVDYYQERSHFADQTAVIADAMSAPFISRAFAIAGTPGEKWKKWEERAGRNPTHSDSGTANTDTASANSDPASVGWPRENRERYYGNGIVSRIPILEEFRIELGRSKIGAPLAIPQTIPEQARPRIKVIYIHDEPRVAHAVALENGITVINTHLSFVPGMNVYQLRKIHHWSKSLPGEKILLGDLNLPGKLPAKIMKWRSGAEQFTYPSWGARLQFDHILISSPAIENRGKIVFAPPVHMLSDHLPLGIEISL